MTNEIAPLISVYITNHNYGRFIKQSIESVLAQTLQDFELIIIDDGSTDNSKDIIETYKQHPKIQIIYQQNKGLNITNNIAMRVARGKYLMRLDADDYLESYALYILSSTLENDPELGLVFPDYYMVDIDGNVMSLERRHSFNKDVSLFDQPAHGACTMVRRQFLLDVGGYDESFSCQDGYDLWVKFITKFKVTNTNLPLFYYRQHGSNLTRNEQRLLDTRAEIKRVYFDRNYQELPVVAVVPVRGPRIVVGDFSLQPLGNKLVIDWLIDEALQASRISLVVVTSPDETICHHVEQRYQGEERLLFISRDPEQARLNVGLVPTIEKALEHPRVQAINPEAVLRVSIEYPFISSQIMDDAVNTLAIFGADSLISVRPESQTFYHHDGDGLKPILNQGKFTRLERDALYQNRGGLVLTRTKFFNDQKVLIGGHVGHITITQKAAHSITSDYDLSVARFLAGNH